MEERFGLPVSTPEAEGVPPVAIAGLLDGLAARGVPMHGLLALRHGKIIAEGYWKPFHAGYLHRIYSCTKSFVSIAVGFLEAEGLARLDDKIVSHFPDKLPPEGAHPYIAEATVRDLLMMASPHTGTTYKRMALDDWTQTFFLCEPSHIPGTVFYYDTSATQVLCALVEKKAGMPLLDYLRPRLLDELGFSTEAYCLKDPVGVSQGGSGLLCTLRDFAKVALCCMQGGKWQGKQLIPAEYIRQATSPQITTFVSSNHMEREYAYGYQFWCFPHNAFAFIGMGGQIALCLPDEDFVLVTAADTQLMPGDDILDTFWETLYPYLAGQAPASVDNTALQARLQSLSLHTVQGGQATPPASTAYQGTYRLDANGLGWSELSFTFEADGGELRFVKKENLYKLAFKYGENMPGKCPENNFDCLTSAAWWDDKTLNIACYLTGEYFAPLRITAYFKQGSTTLYMKNGAELFMRDYNGFVCGQLQK